MKDSISFGQNRAIQRANEVFKWWALVEHHQMIIGEILGRLFLGWSAGKSDEYFNLKSIREEIFNLPRSDLDHPRFD